MAVLQLKLVFPSTNTCSSITCWEKLLLLRELCLMPFGMEISSINITPKMVATVEQSNAAAHQKVTENRKCKALISSHEQQKRLKLDELKSQAAEIDKQIAHLKS